MRQLTQATFFDFLKQTSVKTKLQRELKFITSTQHLQTGEDWEQTELLAVSDKTGAKGVLLIAIENDEGITRALPYELTRRLANATTGRNTAAICDFCATWQPGSGITRITFARAGRASSVSFLCCADLRCSQHVRGKTAAAVASKAQLRETTEGESRLARFCNNLQKPMTAVD